MLRELLTGIVGLCGGMVVATALAAFIIGLGMIPRYAGVTHTGNHLLFYENSLMLGSFLGNLLTNIPFTAKLGMDVGHDSNAFSVLIFLGLGIYMIVKAIKEKPVEEKKDEIISAKQIIVWACITSIDAFIAGIGFGFLETDFLLLVFIIGIATISMVIIGMYIGYWMGCQFRRTAVTIGGCILLFGAVEFIIRTLY